MLFTPRLKAVLFGLFCVLTAAASATPNSELAARIKELKPSGQLEVQGDRIATGELIADFYAQRGYTLAFDDNKIRDLMEGIDRMAAQGLNPDDYHRQVLKAMRDRPPPLAPAARADLELLLMDAFLRMASDRGYGKLNPATLDPNWNFARPLIAKDPVRELTRAMESPSPVRYLDTLLPEAPVYRDLKTALARYRGIAASGGWHEVETGPPLQTSRTHCPKMT
jgi:murein L,D-transpeptidase YcbB/YkuD